jgi:hypothetical protein
MALVTRTGELREVRVEVTRVVRGKCELERFLRLQGTSSIIGDGHG